MANPTFPGLQDQAQQCERAAVVLETAAASLHPPRNGESDEAVALRLRGVSIMLHTAAIEVAITSGWHSAVHEARISGMLDGSDDDG